MSRQEFVQHDGLTIANIERVVGRRLAQGPSLRLEITQERHLELGVCCYEEHFGENQSIQCQAPAVVHERLTEFETCLKHFGKVQGGHEHDWRGVDDGRVCATCLKHERQ